MDSGLIILDISFLVLTRCISKISWFNDVDSLSLLTILTLVPSFCFHWENHSLFDLIIEPNHFPLNCMFVSWVGSNSGWLSTPSVLCRCSCVLQLYSNVCDERMWFCCEITSDRRGAFGATCRLPRQELLMVAAAAGSRKATAWGDRKRRCREQPAEETLLSLSPPPLLPLSLLLPPLLSLISSFDWRRRLTLIFSSIIRHVTALRSKAGHGNFHFSMLVAWC